MNYEHKEPLIQEVIDSFTKLAHRIQAEDDGEQQWLLAHCTNPVLTVILQDISAMMLHVLDAIGKLGPVNGITISKQFGFPKGTISKVTKKLAAKQLIQTEALPGNKKEIIFRMTPLGQELFHLHARLDQHIEASAIRFMNKYPPEQLRLIASFIQDMNQTSWVQLETEQEPS